MSASPYVDKLDPWSSHAHIRAALAELPPGARVLDVGAATGTLGRLCADRGFVLHGIELDPAAAAVARPLYAALHCGDVDGAPDALIAGHDAVVLADILEHLPAPERILSRLVGLQPPGCRYIISVPNIANLYVRLQLLGGRFDYAERGILDRTHLRFFTRRTFAALLAAAGLRVTRLDVTPVPVDQVHRLFAETGPGRVAHRALAAVTRAAPTLLGYQFVATAVADGTAAVVHDAPRDGGRD